MKGGIMKKKEKIVGFAGHRYQWYNIGVKDPLRQTIENLLNKNYTTFYCGDKGYFDELVAEILIELKKKNPQIKIYKILADYHHENEKWELPSCYEGSIYPDLETCHFKAKITKRNQWIVDNIDILVCHIRETYRSGAAKMVKYAQKVNKPIIYLSPKTE